jgi:2-polyprenyl-6-methoxyphenol hydroxylase-like FAD-dependent oxidoreductase
MARNRRDHAVVIGASVAGLAAARVLSAHFERVTVLDRDELPAGTDARRGVPQGRHAHALLGGGARAIEQLFPGVTEELFAAGAVPLKFNEGHWYQAGGYRAPSLVDGTVISASRPFLECHLRRRVADLPNVDFESGVVVHGLVGADGWVRGASVERGGVPSTLRADLIVDCSGRASSAPRWMTELGYDAPETIEVRCDVRYATMLLERTRTDLYGTFAITIETPPNGKRAAFCVPIEGDRWIVTIASSFGAYSPGDEESFHTIAASLPSPEVLHVLEHGRPLGPVVSHRLSSSKRRRYEQLKHVPAGFVALGDAICSFNPIYGQGMSSAVMQAVELSACLDAGEHSERLARAFYKRAAKIVANPWKIAVGADFAYPECTGPKPPGTDLVNRYMKRVLLAAQVSPEVNTEMILVQNLLAPPATLMRPSMVRMVRRAAREAERRIELTQSASGAPARVGAGAPASSSAAH